MDQQEHHLQRAIVAGLIIPTPEVSELPNREYYDKVYPANYKQPRQLIHMQRKLIFSGAIFISNPLWKLNKNKRILSECQSRLDYKNKIGTTQQSKQPLILIRSTETVVSSKAFSSN